jgi:hypothetical protein
LYNAVRRFGKLSFPTLHDPLKLLAHEEDGTVVFTTSSSSSSSSSSSAHLVDIDIFTDGRISVQGIDKVLSPPPPPPPASPDAKIKPASNSRRKLADSLPLASDDLPSSDSDSSDSSMHSHRSGTFLRLLFQC